MNNLTVTLVYDQLHDAQLIAAQLELQGELTCYYHPAEGSPVLVQPSVASQSGLGLLIFGAALVGIGLFTSIIVLILRCHEKKKEYAAISPEASVSLTSPFLNSPRVSNESSSGQQSIRMEVL
jgi:hypothetical protein